MQIKAFGKDADVLLDVPIKYIVEVVALSTRQQVDEIDSVIFDEMSAVDVVNMDEWSDGTDAYE